MDSKASNKIRVLNKLGRDKAHEFLTSKGSTPITRILSDDEYKVALYNKLQEEVAEFLETPVPEELADILEVIHALAPVVCGSREELEKVRLAKFRQRGGYAKKIFILEIHDK